MIEIFMRIFFFFFFFYLNWEKSSHVSRERQRERETGRARDSSQCGVAQKPIKKLTKLTQLSTLGSLMIHRIVFTPRSRRHNEAWHSIHFFESLLPPSSFRYLVNQVSNIIDPRTKNWPIGIVLYSVFCPNRIFGTIVFRSFQPVHYLI